MPDEHVVDLLMFFLELPAPIVRRLFFPHKERHLLLLFDHHHMSIYDHVTIKYAFEPEKINSSTRIYKTPIISVYKTSVT